jgi:hypothetical protein
MPHKELVASHYSKFSLPLEYRLQNPQANGKQELVAGEMSQSLLTNKKQGKNCKVHATRIIKPI